MRVWLVSVADIEPDDSARTLTIRFHRLATPAHDKAVAALIDELNQQGCGDPRNGAWMIRALA